MNEENHQRVAIVGCGNIGSRLLQSLARTDIGAPLIIEGFEPVAGARELAAQRFAEALDGRAHRLRFVDSIAEMREPYLFGIVATDARNRLQALSALLEHGSPRRVVLEKVLFTQPADYPVAEALLVRHKVDAWVNCSRNEWPGYRNLKADIGQQRIDSIEVEGSDWGLACNAIHFLSLAEFLTDSPVASLAWAQEPRPQTREAKRAGYKEILGQLKGETANGTEIRLSSVDRPGQSLQVNVTLPKGRLTIFEDRREMVGDPHGGRDAHRFEIAMASELGPVFSRLIRDGVSDLPTYAQSSALHLTTVAAMNEVFYGEATLSRECPIT